MGHKIPDGVGAPHGEGQHFSGGGGDFVNLQVVGSELHHNSDCMITDALWVQ